jgi:hypothetical protein
MKLAAHNFVEKTVNELDDSMYEAINEYSKATTAYVDL